MSNQYHIIKNMFEEKGFKLLTANNSKINKYMRVECPLKHVSKWTVTNIYKTREIKHVCGKCISARARAEQNIRKSNDRQNTCKHKFLIFNYASLYATNIKKYLCVHCGMQCDSSTLTEMPDPNEMSEYYNMVAQYPITIQPVTNNPYISFVNSEYEKEKILIKILGDTSLSTSELIDAVQKI